MTAKKTANPNPITPKFKALSSNLNIAKKRSKKPRDKLSPYTEINKRLVILYQCTEIDTCWQTAKAEFANEFGRDLEYPLRKYPTALEFFQTWLDSKLNVAGKEPETYFIKSQLLERGWSNVILDVLYPNPDKIVDLGRGRVVYYYLQEKINQLEDGPEFIEYIGTKLAKRRSRSRVK